MRTSGDQRHPSADQVNPYAAPAEAGGYDDLQPFGVGVWRDDTFLVMHQDAELPRFCVHTGEAAVGGREYVLIWNQPGAIFTSSKTVLIPLCRRCIRDFQRLRLQSFLALGLAGLTLPLPFAAPLLGEWGVLAIGGTLVAGTIGVVLWVEALWSCGRPLSVVRARGEYLWLQNVHAGVLKQVPPWPASAP